LASAARWYAEGFAKRSGIELATDIPDQEGRLPRPQNSSFSASFRNP